MLNDRCGNTKEQKCHAKGSRKEAKIQEFMYRAATNVKLEMYNCTDHNCSHRNSNTRLDEKFGGHTRKTLFYIYIYIYIYIHYKNSYAHHR
jgi:hypothetical protein